MTSSVRPFLFILMLGLCSATWGQVKPTTPDQEDYLGPQLRERVEILKQEYTRPPTTRDGHGERFRTLWEWANAFAMQGGQIPPHLPLAVGLVMDARPTQPGMLMRSQLPHFVRDLTLKEEQPGALGKTAMLDQGPFHATSFQTIRQTYTFGELGMVTKGKILCGRQFSSDHGAMQNTDPKGENYVSIQASNPAARFAPTRPNLFGPHGNLVIEAPLVAFELIEGALAPGDVITVTYGDTSEGSPGFQIHTFEGDEMYLPLYVDLEANGTYYTPFWESFAVVGVMATQVHAIVPSMGKPGEAFSISIRTEDHFYNRATSGIPAYTASLNDKEIAKIPAGDSALSVIDTITIDSPGIHYIHVASEDGQFSTDSNPILIDADSDHGIFWGDTHAHIGYSEGTGSMDHFFTWARDDARLDFVSLTEHDIFLDDWEWQTMVDGTAKYFDEGTFITFLGYEWTANVLQGGHHNVIYRTNEQERVAIQDTPNLEDLYTGLKDGHRPEDVVTIPHAHTPGNWEVSEPDYERLVEISSMHGSFEWFANNYLKNGFKVGFVAASDDHRAQPGYTSVSQQVLIQRGGLGAVLAPAKDKNALFDAMRDRHTYATTGERMILSIEANEHPMGSMLTQTDAISIQGTIAGTTPILDAALIKNGEVVESTAHNLAPYDGKRDLLISFESSSDPFVRDTPRGERIWEGTATIEGARLDSVTNLGMENIFKEFARQSKSNAQQAEFMDGTRGQSDSMLLSISEGTPDGSLTIYVKESSEGLRVLSVNERAANAYAETTLTIPFSELEDGIYTKTFEQGKDIDSITVRVISETAERVVELAESMRSDATPGDYFYIRVTQMDGGIAWSSPWWIE